MKIKNKTYLPLEKQVDGFSCFKDTHYALYIAESSLFLLDFESGKSKKLRGYTDVSQVKCINQTTFIVATFEKMYHSTFIDGKFKVKKSYDIGSSAAQKIDATDNLDLIGISTHDRFVFVSKSSPRVMSRSLIEETEYTMAIANKNDWVASGSENKLVLKSIFGNRDGSMKIDDVPLCISFSPDDNTLIYGDDKKNIVSVDLNSGQTTRYENTFFSKPKYIGWIDQEHFVISFLSSGVGIYKIGQQEARHMTLDDFPDRYSQHADLVSSDIIAVCIEKSRLEDEANTLPDNDVVVLLHLNEEQ